MSRQEAYDDSLDEKQDYVFDPDKILKAYDDFRRILPEAMDWLTIENIVNSPSSVRNQINDKYKHYAKSARSEFNRVSTRGHADDISDRTDSSASADLSDLNAAKDTLIRLIGFIEQPQNQINQFKSDLIRTLKKRITFNVSFLKFHTSFEGDSSPAVQQAIALLNSQVIKENLFCLYCEEIFDFAELTALVQYVKENNDITFVSGLQYLNKQFKPSLTGILNKRITFNESFLKFHASFERDASPVVQQAIGLLKDPVIKENLFCLYCEEIFDFNELGELFQHLQKQEDIACADVLWLLRDSGLLRRSFRQKLDNNQSLRERPLLPVPAAPRPVRDLTDFFKLIAPDFKAELEPELPSELLPFLRREGEWTNLKDSKGAPIKFTYFDRAYGFMNIEGRSGIKKGWGKSLIYIPPLNSLAAEKFEAMQSGLTEHFSFCRSHSSVIVNADPSASPGAKKYRKYIEIVCEGAWFEQTKAFHEAIQRLYVGKLNEILTGLKDKLPKKGTDEVLNGKIKDTDETIAEIGTIVKESCDASYKDGAHYLQATTFNAPPKGFNGNHLHTKLLQCMDKYVKKEHIRKDRKIRIVVRQFVGIVCAVVGIAITGGTVLLSEKARNGWSSLFWYNATQRTGHNVKNDYEAATVRIMRGPKT